MDPRLKSIIRNAVPKRVLKKLVGTWNGITASRSKRARRKFESMEIPHEPQWLLYEDIGKLIQRYPKPQRYSYDAESVERRGKERAREILDVLPKWERGMKSIELGALDAMASFFLAEKGFISTAIDISDSHFFEKVRKAGVTLSVMSATELEFPDNSFDLAFSYNAFEHIDDPEEALKEAIRVLKPGGYLYLNFGPIYYSAMGLHAHQAIPIPYLQFLFDRKTLEKYLREHKVGNIEFDTMNGWSASRFRELFEKYSGEIEKVRYVERLENYGIDLIERYPGCFRGKVERFDELLISAIEGLWRKR